MNSPAKRDEISEQMDDVILSSRINLLSNIQCLRKRCGVSNVGYNFSETVLKTHSSDRHSLKCIYVYFLPLRFKHNFKISEKRVRLSKKKKTNLKK